MVILPKAPDLRALKNPAERDRILSQPEHAMFLAWAHPGLWFALFGVIRDKQNRLRPVVGTDPSGKPYEGVHILQWEFFEVAAYFYHHGLPFRGIGLKPRKTGLSTAVQAYLYWRHRREGIDSLTAGDKDGTSATIQRIFRTFAENDACPWGNQVSEAMGTFKFSHGGQAARETVRNTNMGRGSTPLCQHRSEVAHFLEGEKINATDVLMGANEATALVPGSFIMDESTPNGWGNYFAKEYWGDEQADSPELRAGAVSFADWQKGKKGNGYVKFFAPWYRFKDNDDKMASAEDLAKIKATLTTKEMQLMRTVKSLTGRPLTLSQISWRRQKVVACRSEAAFIQEHTEDERMCFLLAGRPFFDMAALDEHLVRARSAAPPEQGVLTRGFEQRVMFDPQQDGPYLIWERPQRGMSYVAVVDTMTGASQVKDASKADEHAVFIIRESYAQALPDGTVVQAPPRIAARIAPPFQDDTMPALEKFYRLLDYYGRPMSLVEVNNSGLSWVDRMPSDGYPVCHHVMDPIDMGKEPSRRRGWLTSPRTRRPQIDALADLVRNHDVLIEDVHALQQMQTFVHHPDGSIKAASGNHDDDVMALSIWAYNRHLARQTMA